MCGAVQQVFSFFFYKYLCMRKNSTNWGKYTICSFLRTHTIQTEN